jgi:hypothetical protein
MREHQAIIHRQHTDWPMQQQLVKFCGQVVGLAVNVAQYAVKESSTTVPLCKPQVAAVCVCTHQQLSESRPALGQILQCPSSR